MVEKHHEWFGSVATVEHGVPLMQPNWDQPMGLLGRQARRGVKTGVGPPHLLPKKMDKLCQDPGRGVGGLRVQPLPGYHTRGMASGSHSPAGGRATPGASSVLKRIRTPTWVLGARRLGLQEEGRGLGLGRWGSQRITSTFPKG